MDETKNKKLTRLIISAMTGAALLGIFIALGLFSGEFFKKLADNNFQIDITPNPSNAISTPTPFREPSPVTEENISAIVDCVMPAMVTVQCKIEKKSTDFWGRPAVSQSASAGSGIIIAQNDEYLYLVTNEHVVNGATLVEVTFTNGATHKVTVKGSDENSDIAVLELKTSALEAGTLASVRVASLGNSESLKAGDLAIAIGNALGQGQSLTAGYISATKREITVNNVTRTLIQTDAAINPGNSGGALINANGEVIGINSAKYASENVERIGYAIPMADAIPIITNIMNREVLSAKDAGSLGISGQTVTSAYSSRFGIPVGVYVNQVKAGSAAKKAGIKEGDVIVAINEISISTTEDLEKVLSYNRAGSTVTVTLRVLEDNKYAEHTVEVVLDSK